MSSYPIRQRPIHLGLGAIAVVQPEFTGSMDWYGAYAQRHQADGVEGRLVSQFSFDKPWDMWEIHPSGSEVVLCIAGRITLYQEHADGARGRVSIGPGEYAINAPGMRMEKASQRTMLDVADRAWRLVAPARLIRERDETLPSASKSR